MQRFENILVCLELVDDQEFLIARAVELARGSEGRLTLMHVIEEYRCAPTRR